MQTHICKPQTEAEWVEAESSPARHKCEREREKTKEIEKRER